MSRRVVALVALFLVGGCAGARIATTPASMKAFSRVGDARVHGDQANAITIEADRYDRRDEDGLVIFMGNVEVRHRNWLRYADHVKVYWDGRAGHIL